MRPRIIIILLTDYPMHVLRRCTSSSHTMIPCAPPLVRRCTSSSRTMIPCAPPPHAQVHVIFTHKEKNYLIKKDIPAKTDQLTHVYTLVLKPDNTFKVRAHGPAWRCMGVALYPAMHCVSVSGVPPPESVPPPLIPKIDVGCPQDLPKDSSHQFWLSDAAFPSTPLCSRIPDSTPRSLLRPPCAPPLTPSPAAPSPSGVH